METDKPAKSDTRTSSPVLKRVEYTDKSGFKYIMLVPDGREDEAAKGILLGPPDLGSLKLPKRVQKELNRQLYDQGIITWKDARHNRRAVELAVKAALKFDVDTILNLYREA